MTSANQNFSFNKTYVLIICTAVIIFSCQFPVSVYDMPKSDGISAKVSSAQYLNSIDYKNSAEWRIKMMMELKNSEWEVDVKIVEDIMGMQSNNIEILQLAVDYYLSTGQSHVADSLNQLALAMGANGPEFYSTMSKTSAALKKYDLAIDQINKAILINRYDPDLYSQKGEVYLAFEDTVSAIIYLKRAFSFDSTRHDVRYRIANLYIANSQFEEAENWLVGYDSRNDGEDFQLLLVQIYLYQNRISEANITLTDLLRKGNILAGVTLIDYYKTLSLDDSVFYYCNEVLIIDSLNLKAMNYKASVFENKGYFSSALQYYEKTLSIDSLNEVALNGVEKVNGKIAYLRKLKERRESIPTFDFTIRKKKSDITNE